MSTISKWSGVSVSLGTLGTAVPISDITKEDPGVVYHGGAVRTLAEFIALTDINGMTQVNSRAFRVAAPMSVSPGPTFQLEGEDTTSYGTFTSGNLKPITFSYSMSGGTTVSASGGDSDSVDITTIHDLQRKELPNLRNALVFNFDCFWDPSDAFLAAAVGFDTAQTQVALKLVFQSGGIFVAVGYVGASLAPTGNAGEVVKTPVSFRAGIGTAYSS